MLKVYLTNNVSDFDKYACTIFDTNPSVIGLDTETDICGVGVDVLQLCYEGKEMIFDYTIEIPLYNTDKHYNVCIFLLSKYKLDVLPNYIKKILKSKNIVKVGCDITTDIMRINQKYVGKIDGCVDTQYIAKSIGMLDYSLDSLSKKFLGINKSKTDLSANWSENITTKQLKYAAMDAYMSLLTYTSFFKYDNTNNKKNIVNDIIFNVEDEYEDLLYFLVHKSTIFNNDKNTNSVNKITNVIINGYTKWIKLYSRTEIMTNAKNAIVYLCDNCYFEYDEMYDEIKLNTDDSSRRVKHKNTSFTQNEIKLLTPDIINRIRSIEPASGMKLKSLINFIHNSLWSTESHDVRHTKSEFMVKYLIEHDYLVRNNNKYYVNKKI